MTGTVDAALLGASLYSHYADHPQLTWSTAVGLVAFTPLFHVAAQSRHLDDAITDRTLWSIVSLAGYGLYKVGERVVDTRADDLRRGLAVDRPVHRRSDARIRRIRSSSSSK